jgi:hypothetical protein
MGADETLAGNLLYRVARQARLLRLVEEVSCTGGHTSLTERRA